MVDSASPISTETLRSAAPPQRQRKDLTRISAQEYLILIRMKRIDRGQGCHAAVERIGHSYDDRHQSFSPAQTRRHLRRLRELGEIHFAGQTPDGRNVYLFPERTYNREDVPIDLGRPVDHLQALPSGASWSTEKAAQILKLSERGEAPCRTTLIDGYPVNRQILKSYSEATIRRSIGRLKETYPTMKNIQNPTALLRHFLNLEIQEQKKRQAAAAEATTALPTKPRSEARLPLEAEKRILALLREGRPLEANQLAAELAAGTLTAPDLTDAQSSKAEKRAMVTVAAVVEHYLKRKQGSAAKPSCSYHGQKAASLIRLLGVFSVCELTPAELTLYQRKRRADRVSERTAREEVKVLRQALELGVSAGLVERDVVDGLGMPPGRAGPRRAACPAKEVAPCR